MQKTFTSDFMTDKREKNRGQLDTYLVENAHEPIIDKETFQLVQRMEEDIKKQKEGHQIVGASGNEHPHPI